MHLYQNERTLLDFGGPERARHVLNDLGFTCTRSGSAYAFDKNAGMFISQAANTFRFCGIGGRVGLLCEQQHVNYALYSATPNNAAWVAGANVSKASATSCIESQTAGKITSVDGGAVGVTQTIGTMGSATSFCFIFEEGDGDLIDFGIYDSTAGNYACRLRYTVATGAVTQVSATATVTDFGMVVLDSSGQNSGKTVAAFGILNTSGISGNSRTAFFYPTNTANKFSYLHYVGIHNDAVVTSPIVTAGASATRNADYIAAATLPNWYRQAGTSFYYELFTCNKTATSIAFTVDDGTANNYVIAGVTSGIDIVTHTRSAVSVNASNISAISTNQIIRLGGGYSASAVYGAINGSAVSQPVAGTISLTNMHLGSADGAFYLNGKICMIQFYPATLSAGILAGLTS